MRRDSIISLSFMFIVFFIGRTDPCVPALPFELIPKKDITYRQIVWWLKHYPFLYKPKIVQIPDLWPAGRPDGRVDFRDLAIFANHWLKEK